MFEIMIDLQGDTKLPLYEKIYEHIRDEIVVGRIPVGERLPSTRLLARNLAVSRSTVETAYDQLLAEGYIRTEPCRGVFVCDITGLYQLRPQQLHRQQLYRQQELTVQQVNSESREREKQKSGPCGRQEEPRWIDFSPYLVDTRHFPWHIWKKISRNLLSDDREELLLSGCGQGEYTVRQAIASYLYQARGVLCSASDVILGAGNEYLELLLAQILGPDRTILMEDPGYPQAYRTFTIMGYRVHAVPASGAGSLAEGPPDCDLIYIMPSHQFPVGTVMPLKQRLALLAWAATGEGRYLIEDDHDSEYRYRGKPVPSLQGMDRHGKVIYLGTFSKSIAPSLRVSYMVLPPDLMECYRRKCGFYSVTVPRMQQEILGEFITGGHFERHLNKMRGIYRGRHDFLLGELKKRDWAVRVSGEHAGLHLLVQAHTGQTEQRLCAAAAARGVKLSGLSEYRLGLYEETTERGAKAGAAAQTGRRTEDSGKRFAQNDGFPVLVLGYGGLNEEEIARGLLILDEMIKEGR